MSSMGGDDSIEKIGSHVLHTTFVLLSLTMAAWTLYLDLRFFTTFQRGGYFMRFTHWSLMLTLLFLVVSLLDAFTGGTILAAPRRWLLYPALVLALTVDVNFFMVALPRRWLKLDKHAHVTPVSAHKHLLNLPWILGDAGTYGWSQNTLHKHNNVEMAIAGILVPVIVSAAYFTLASAIKDKKRGAQVLKALGIPTQDDLKEDPDAMPGRKRSAILEQRTARPGHWIYASFRHKKLRTVFLLSPFFYAPLARVLLAGAEKLLIGRPPVQLALLISTGVVTPLLYGPELWKRNRATLLHALLQTKHDVLTVVNVTLANVGAFLAEIRRRVKAARARSKERRLARNKRLKKLIPVVQERVRSAAAQVLEVTVELGQEVGQVCLKGGALTAYFFTQIIPGAAEYAVHVAQDLVLMVKNDMLEATVEMREWVENGTFSDVLFDCHVVVGKLRRKRRSNRPTRNNELQSSWTITSETVRVLVQ